MNRNKREECLFRLLVGRTVTVKVQNRVSVSGRLLAFESGNRDGHAPSLLVLENSEGKHVLRGSFDLFLGGADASLVTCVLPEYAWRHIKR